MQSTSAASPAYASTRTEVESWIQDVGRNPIISVELFPPVLIILRSRVGVEADAWLTREPRAGGVLKKDVEYSVHEHPNVVDCVDRHSDYVPIDRSVNLAPGRIPDDVEAAERSVPLDDLWSVVV